MLWPNGTLIQPTVSSHFGPRKSTIAGASTVHKGTDFVGFTLVKAIDDGIVTEVGTPLGWNGGGYQVWILHDDGSVSRYLHLSRNSSPVTVGRRVAEGQLIGIMGNTGTATGTHLHLETVVNGTPIDPVPYIRANLTKPETAGQETEDDEMTTFIMERANNSQAAKSLYDVKSGRAIRAISKDENKAFRAAGNPAVVYIPVSDTEYRQRGGF